MDLRHAPEVERAPIVVWRGVRAAAGQPRARQHIIIFRRGGIDVSGLSAFGLFAVTAMLVTYAMEERSHWFVLAFAGACALGSTYGFLQGAWPFGLVGG